MTESPVSPPLWRQIQRKTFTQWQQLSSFLELDEVHFEKIVSSAQFPLNLPYRLAEKIEKNNINDPILRQFLPIADEEIVTPGYSSDPVGDLRSRKQPKLLHKYVGRALLVTTSSCAMHCRFCFRRHFSYDIQDKLFLEELQMIQADASLEEIILSGGDPLSLSNEVLKNLLLQLNAIEHIKKIRFHTRFPIGIPERIDKEFLELLSSLQKQVVFIVHINHPKELDDDVIAALKKVQALGIPVLNQAVLLKGVNDSEEVLYTLFNKLTNCGILPYYLHQLDKVQGAAHFEVDEVKGLELLQRLREKLPGYAIPRYVKEIAGELSKTPIDHMR